MNTKNIVATSCLLITAVLLFTSCKKVNNSTSKTYDYYFKVSIDGVEHSFDKGVYVNSSSLKVGLIAITPNDGKGKNMSIAISSKDTRATGTFTNEFTAVYFQEGVAGVWDAERNMRTVTILENNDDFIEGTFSFTARNLKDDTIKKLTEGTFRARK